MTASSAALKVIVELEKVARLESLYDASLKMIADRDALIERLRRELGYAEDAIETFLGMTAEDFATRKDKMKRLAAEIDAVFREPTP